MKEDFVIMLPYEQIDLALEGMQRQDSELGTKEDMEFLLKDDEVRLIEITKN